MRVAALLMWAVAALAVLLPALRRPMPRPGRDQLVKDPVCQTYVVRSRAVSRGVGDEAAFFCSAECARRYAGV